MRTGNSNSRASAPLQFRSPPRFITHRARSALIPQTLLDLPIPSPDDQGDTPWTPGADVKLCR